VERERLRVPEKTEEEYRDYFNSDKVNRLIDDILEDRLAVSQIMLLLKDNPLSTQDISKQLGLNPSDVSRHMNSTSRHGLVRYDMDSSQYALAT
jgi:DNA-binding MarR family transcriptional regulator